ncbi:hypothetical protein [Ammoniphilus sp. CFH 90114]|uniref:hypothetical protein n=1 Tax=Ammoniphilus sp. CFH 90114 TaxID=2493665 RepID=UPI00100FAACA|nr:hypothetical protein [Ammoniphilus sp. CFH 90114]RXT13520.1 hypothetical protein EIZ39_05040 [Ammoniphilus sp. CFH 90114]
MSSDREQERFSERRVFNEETASEFTPRLPAPAIREEKDEDFDTMTQSSLHDVQEGEGSGTAVGIVGLVLSLASLFTLPFLLALIGIGAGFVATRRGAHSLGRWAIGVGVISMIGAILFAPFVG